MRGDVAAALSPSATEPEPRLGILANGRQFALLVLVNAFVGAMVGLERTVLPLLAEAEFGVASATALLTFVGGFGLAKAGANLVAGSLADRHGRKRILVVGWLLGVPVPFLVAWAPSWGWVVGANLLLGLNQGLAWSATVIMKIDLAGPERRGLAMGLNEASGYLAVAGAAYLTGEIAARFGLSPAPFYLGIALAAAGLVLSALLVRETTGHARLEAGGRDEAAGVPGRDDAPGGTAGAFARASWGDPTLLACSQAGLVNNLNDGLAWGLFPLFFAGAGLPVERIGILTAAYPATWGLLQVGTGALSDRWGRKPLVVAGMTLQGTVLLLLPALSGFGPWLLATGLLGAGTALVYPTLLATVGDRAHPSWRARAVGTYRLWRDLGYVAGAVVAGAAADGIGLDGTIALVGVVTLVSGIAAGRLMEPAPRAAAPGPARVR